MKSSAVGRQQGVGTAPVMAMVLTICDLQLQENRWLARLPCGDAIRGASRCSKQQTFAR